MVHCSCPACSLTKKQKGKYRKKTKRQRSKHPYEFIHTDLMEASTESITISNETGRYKYSVVFIDDCTDMDMS